MVKKIYGRKKLIVINYFSGSFELRLRKKRESDAADFRGTKNILNNGLAWPAGQPYSNIIYAYE